MRPRPVRLRPGDAGGRQDPRRLALGPAVSGGLGVRRPRRGAQPGERRVQPAAAVRPAGRHRRRWLRRHRDPAGLDRLRIRAAARAELARYSPARIGRPAVGPARARRGGPRLVSVLRRRPVGPVAGRRRGSRGLAVRFVGAFRARRSPADRDHVRIERSRSGNRRSAGPPHRTASSSSAGRPGRICSSALHR